MTPAQTCPHPDAIGPHREARRLLMAGPCPLADAERAVEAFARVARRLAETDDDT